MYNKKELLMISFIIILFVLISYKYIKDTTYPKVLESISLEYAKQSVDNNENYLMVTSQLGATGAQFEISYGINKGSDIELMQNSPMVMLSNIYFLSKPNTFLVKGTGIDKNSDNIGIPFDDAYPNIYSIEVESWQIIIPIYRDYQYRLYGQKSRLFSPIK